MSDNVNLDTMPPELRAQWEEYLAAKAKRAHALRVWSGRQAAEKRWGKDRPRTRRVKLYGADADTLVKLARARRCTAADIVAQLLAAPPIGAKYVLN